MCHTVPQLPSSGVVQHFWRWSGNIAAVWSRKNAAVEAPAQWCVPKGKVTSSELFFPNPLCWVSRLPPSHTPEITQKLLETTVTQERHRAYTFLSGLPFTGQHRPAQHLRVFQILSTFASHITSVNFSTLLIFTFKCFARFWSKAPTSFSASLEIWTTTLWTTLHNRGFIRLLLLFLGADS